MPTACIQQSGARVQLESESLLVTWQDEAGSTARRFLPLHDIDRVILTSSVSITTPALAEALRRGIPVSITDAWGRFLGAFHPATTDHGAARLLHYRMAMNSGFCLDLSRRIIAAKIHNQRRLLQRVAANRQAAEKPVPTIVPDALTSMDRAMGAATAAPSLDVLRGHEGIASARYFPAWASLLPPEFPFTRRSTRPPLDPVNAALSFASTLIYHEAHAFIHTHGLDPSLGLLHATENGRWSLALDLMEPFRPVVAEALVLDLFSHKMLHDSHFTPAEGGIHLTGEGRAKLLLQYEKRMERQFMSEATGHRTTLRRQLENQTILFKAALDSPDRFQPFRMN